MTLGVRLATAARQAANRRCDAAGRLLAADNSVQHGRQRAGNERRTATPEAYESRSQEVKLTYARVYIESNR